MKITYTRVHPSRSAVEFCRFSDVAQNRLRVRLDQQIFLVSESSVDPHSELWTIAQTANAETWGRSRLRRANTMLAVLAGAREKITRGDLSVRQLAHVQNIDRVFAELNIMEPVEYQDITDD